MTPLKALNCLLIFLIVSMHAGLYEITGIKGTVIAVIIIGIVLCEIFNVNLDRSLIYRFLDSSVYFMFGTVLGEVVFNIGLMVI